MKRHRSAAVTPLEVVQPKNLSFYGVRIGSTISSISSVSWWLFGIVVAGVLMISLGAGTTPKSFAQDTVKDMPTMEDWDKLAQCESGGNWSIDNGKGHTGGIQFDQQTWKSNGGKTENAKDASKEEQIAVAEKVWKERGWQPWSECAKDFSIDGPTDESTGSVVAAAADSGSGKPSDSAESPETEPESTSGGSSSSGGVGSITARDRSENDPGALEDTESDISDEHIISADLGDPRYASPQQYAAAVPSTRYESITSAVNYLPTARWQNVNLLSLAPVNGMSDISGNGINNAMTYISQVLFKISQAFFYYIELLLLYTLSADILTKGSYLANQAFFVTGQKVAAIQDEGNGNYSFSMPFLLVLAMGMSLVIALTLYIMPGRAATAYRREFTTIAVVSLASSAVLILLVVRAGQDVASKDGGYGTSVASQTLSDAPLLQFANNSDAVKKAEEASNWTLGSPGWIVATLTTIANDISSFLAGLTYLVTNTINRTAMREQTQCQIYSNALYATFASTSAAQNMGDGRTNTVIAYDRMIQSLFQQNYAAGAMSDTLGTQNAWCRMAEIDTNRPAGEQAMISRVAGLNREAVGTGGLGLITNASGNVRKDGYVANINSINIPNRGGQELEVTGGEFVDDNGQWKALEDKERNVLSTARTTQTVQRPAFDGAQNYFGPSFGADNPKAAKLQATYYWAACQWGKTNEDGSDDNTGTYHAGGTVSINPEWRNVLRAQGDQNQVLSPDDCLGSITSSKVGQGFGENWNDSNVNDVQSAHFEFSVMNDQTARIDEPSDEDNGCSNPISCGWSKVKDVGGSAISLGKDALNTVTGGTIDAAGDAAGAVKAMVQWMQESTPKPNEVYGKNFESAQSVSGGNNAMDYLMRTSGYNATPAIVTAVVSLLIAYMVVRMIGGLILGGLLATVMALVALIFGVAFLIALIIPLPFIRRGAAAVGKTVVSSFLVDGFMILVFAALFSLNELLRTIILPVTQDVISSAILGSVIACLTFYAFGKLVHYFTNYDISKFSDAVKIMPLSAAPFINGFGGKTDTVVDKARKAAGKIPGRNNKQSTAKKATSSSATDAQRREAERRQLQDQYNDNERKRQARRAEADERQRQKRQMKRNNKRRRRDVADAAAAAATATGYGLAPASAHSVGKRVWRPLSDGTSSAAQKSSDGIREMSRKLQDGHSYRAQQAKLAALDDASGIDENSAAAAEAMSPNGQTTATDEQLLRTGAVYPNSDNVESFDAKIPGAMSNASGPMGTQNIADAVVQHDAAMAVPSTSLDRPRSEIAGQAAALQSVGVSAAPLPANGMFADSDSSKNYKQMSYDQIREMRLREHEAREANKKLQSADSAQPRVQEAMRSNDAVRGFAKTLVSSMNSDGSSTRDALRNAKTQNDSRGVGAAIGLAAAKMIQNKSRGGGN